MDRKAAKGDPRNGPGIPQPVEILNEVRKRLEMERVPEVPIGGEPALGEGGGGGRIHQLSKGAVWPFASRLNGNLSLVVSSLSKSIQPIVR